MNQKEDSTVMSRHQTGQAHEAQEGFSLVELMVSVVISVVILTVAITVYSSAMQTRDREHLVSEGNAKINGVFSIVSREIGNSGFGLVTNGIVLEDSGATKIRFRANTSSDDSVTDDIGEDITIYFDADRKSIIRFDPTVGSEVLASGVNSMTFEYSGPGGGLPGAVPAATTVSVAMIIELQRKRQPSGNQGDFITHRLVIPLRNSPTRLASY